MAYYLSYWKNETARRQLGRGGELGHSASKQYRKIKPGDSVYVITSWPTRRLILLGRIIVAEVVTQRDAEVKLGTSDIWRADWHILASEGTKLPIVELDITDVAGSLRFRSTHDRLALVDGGVSVRQLRAMRELTAESAQILDALLSTATEHADTRPDTSGPGLTDPSRRSEVEAAAISFVTNHYESKGWEVVSHESLDLGYDLMCTRRGVELAVEVKGTQASTPSFVLTANELAASRDRPDWLLAVVTGALSGSPQLRLVPGGSLNEQFVLKPIAYRGLPR